MLPAWEEYGFSAKIGRIWGADAQAGKDSSRRDRTAGGRRNARRRSLVRDGTRAGRSKMPALDPRQSQVTAGGVSPSFTARRVPGRSRLRHAALTACQAWLQCLPFPMQTEGPLL